MKIIMLAMFLIINCAKNQNILKNINKDINDDLILAINNNDTSKAIELIRKGANINYLLNNKNVLELALDNKNLDVLKELIEKGAEVSKENILRIYDLVLEDFNYALIDLIKDKYKLEEGLIDNNKYFLLLCYISNVEIIERFIKENNIIPKEIKDKSNRNALNIAAVGDRIDIFKMMINKYNIDINTINNNGSLPLMIAFNRNNKKLIEFIIKKGANINYKNNNGKTALMYASQKGYKKIIKMLLEKGANINDKSNGGETALIFASTNNHKEVVELLLEKGANINERTSNNDSALLLAATNGHIDIVKLLVEKGVNVNDKNNRGETALMFASQNGYIDIVKLLVEKGANINERTSNNDSALLLAATKGHIDVTKVLVEKGANINDTNNDGWSSLLVSSYKGFVEIVKLLLDKGANINHKNINGTALILAVFGRHIDLVKILLEKGANVNDKNNDGWTALLVASCNGSPEIVKLLLENLCEINDNVKLNNVIEELLIDKIKNSDIVNSFLIISNYKDKIKFNFKDEKGNTFLHYTAMINNSKLFDLFLNNNLDVNALNNEGKNPLYYLLFQDNIDEDFIWYLLSKKAILKPFINFDKIINILSPYNGLCYKIVYEPLIKSLLSDIDLKYEDRLSLIEIIKLIKLDENVFNNNPKMLNYIKNIYNFKYNKTHVIINDIDNLSIDDDIEDVLLDIDFLVGAIFDLESKNQYYGGNNLDEVKKNFKSRLKSIAKTKTPSSIPSINASEEDKTNYIKYLTKKKLRDLGKSLTNSNTQEREEKIVSIMNYLLINLSCHVGTLEAVTNAYNSLLNNDMNKDLEELIGRELMLYRVKLIEDTAKKYFNKSSKCKIVSKVNNVIIENIVEYNEHMKAYLVMDLKEELKVTGFYEKDFKYNYDKQFIINEVKRVYKEKALKYIMKIIIRSRILQNKILEYIQSGIFKDIVSNNKDILTVLHIENFINDEDCNLTKEAIISLLLHFNFLKINSNN